MTINKLIERLIDTGDEKFRDMATVEVNGTTWLGGVADEDGEPIEVEVCADVLDVTYGVNKVILSIT